MFFEEVFVTTVLRIIYEDLEGPFSKTESNVSLHLEAQDAYSQMYKCWQNLYHNQLNNEFEFYVFQYNHTC